MGTQESGRRSESSSSKALQLTVSMTKSISKLHLNQEKNYKGQLCVAALQLEMSPQENRRQKQEEYLICDVTVVLMERNSVEAFH